MVDKYGILRGAARDVMAESVPGAANTSDARMNVQSLAERVEAGDPRAQVADRSISPMVTTAIHENAVREVADTAERSCMFVNTSGRRGRHPLHARTREEALAFAGCASTRIMWLAGSPPAPRPRASAAAASPRRVARVALKDLRHGERESC